MCNYFMVVVYLFETRQFTVIYLRQKIMFDIYASIRSFDNIFFYHYLFTFAIIFSKFQLFVQITNRLQKLTFLKFN